MTDYQYTVEYTADREGKHGWVKSLASGEKWHDSVRELLKAINPEEVAPSGCYRITRRPTRQTEVME